MKALVKAKPERGIWMQDIDQPTVGHNDVLIEVTRTAICGTDIHIYQWDEWAQHTIPVPLIPAVAIAEPPPQDITDSDIRAAKRACLNLTM